MKNNSFVPIKETIFIALGELLTSAIVVSVFLLIGKFDYTVALGVTLGSLVIILNFLFMSIAVNRAIDEAFALRDNYVDEPEPNTALPKDGEKSVHPDADSGEDEGSENEDEEAEEKLDAAMRFAREQSARVNRISKTAYIVRTLTIVAALAVALFTKVFNPIATVIPMLMLRPIILAEGLLRKKK